MEPGAENSSVEALAKELAALSQETSSFMSKRGLSCPQGCGRCCENPKGIWSTVAEMLPLARNLWELGQAEDLYEQIISERSNEATCVLYESHGPGRGRCRQYSFRPTVCALFGASTRREKNGEVRILKCPLQFSLQPDPGSDDSDSQPLDAADWTRRVQLAAPNSELQESYPINLAIAKAIEHLAWHYKFHGAATDRNKTTLVKVRL